jgi:hypothetical protein
MSYLNTSTTVAQLSPTSTPTDPIAKSELQSLRTEMELAGLKAILDSLPPVSCIDIQQQTYVRPSEHPYQICIGALQNSRVFAVLRKQPARATSHGYAPDMAFYTTGNSTIMNPLGKFQKLDTVTLLEPFRSLWRNTRELVVPGTTRHGWDQRRGMVKSLVYWYFLAEAVERDGTCRFPAIIRVRYFKLALARVGTAEISSTTVQDSTTQRQMSQPSGREGTAEIETLVDSITDMKREQAEAEHIHEEARERPIQTTQEGDTTPRESSPTLHQASTTAISDTIPTNKRRRTQAPLSTQSDLNEIPTVRQHVMPRSHPTPKTPSMSTNLREHSLMNNDAGQTDTVPNSLPTDHETRPSTPPSESSAPSYSSGPEVSQPHLQLPTTIPRSSFITSLRRAVDELGELNTELNTIQKEEDALRMKLRRLATRKRSAEWAFDDKKGMIARGLGMGEGLA